MCGSPATGVGYRDAGTLHQATMDGCVGHLTMHSTTAMMFLGGDRVGAPLTSILPHPPQEKHFFSLDSLPIKPCYTFHCTLSPDNYKLSILPPPPS